MTKYKYFKSKNYRANVNLVVESDIVEVSDQTSEGGDFIPLSGTEVGSPVTGDIEIEDDSYDFKIKRGLGDFKREIVWSDDGFIKLIVTNEDDENRTELTAEETVSYSKNPIKHNVDKSSVNITDALYYAQRAYVNAIIINTNTTAINNRKYTAIATLTVTDPTPVEGQGYIVFVRNGTTTIGGVGYTSGNLIYRFYQGGAWSSTVFVNQTQLDTKQDTLVSATNIKTVNGETLLGSGDISISGGSYIINQTPDNGAYSLLAGNVDGVNDLFTVSSGQFLTGSLVVYLNGQLLTQGASNDYVETSPSAGTFTFNTPPTLGSVITAMYSTASGNITTDLFSDSFSNVLVWKPAFTLFYLAALGLTEVNSINRTFTSSPYARLPRRGYRASAGVGSVAGARRAASLFTSLNAMEYWEITFTTQNSSPTSVGMRTFIGLQNITTDIATNIEYNTLLSCIGVGRLSSSNNMHVFHNDDSGTATTIDLGSNFPMEITGEDAIYKVRIFKSDTGEVTVNVKRNLTAFESNTVITTDIFGFDEPLTHKWGINNGAIGGTFDMDVFGITCKYL
jgi:hypothetical protein